MYNHMNDFSTGKTYFMHNNINAKMRFFTQRVTGAQYADPYQLELG